MGGIAEKTTAQLQGEKEAAQRAVYLDGKRAALDKTTLPRIWTAGEIERTEFPKLNYVVDGLIAEGLTVLAGSQKIGKSLLSLAIAAEVSRGGKVLGTIGVEKQEVLYISLEDGPRRIQNRFVRMGLFPDHKNLRIAAAWGRGDAALLQLEKYIETYPDTRLIIVDTLAKVLPIGTDGNDFHEIYDAAGKFKEFADRFGVAVVLVHHVRKQGAGSHGDDFVSRIIGSTGLTAAADSIITLARGRGETDGTLECTGRDIEEKSLALTFDKEILQWTIIGDAREIQKTKERQDIVDILKAADRPLKTSEIAKATGKSDSNISHLLYELKKEGVVSNPSYGKWTTCETLQTIQTIQSSSAGKDHLSIQGDMDFDHFDHFEGIPKGCSEKSTPITSNTSLHSVRSIDVQAVDEAEGLGELEIF